VHIVPIECNNESCLLYMHVMYCALLIGFLDEDVIGCMVVPFLMYPYFRSIYVYRLDVLCLIDRLW
jgi:hypothetical protein